MTKSTDFFKVQEGSEEETCLFFETETIKSHRSYFDGFYFSFFSQNCGLRKVLKFLSRKKKKNRRRNQGNSDEVEINADAS